MSQPQHHYQDLINLFDCCFAIEYNTRLVKGDNEPLYLPAHETQTYHAVIFAHGFFSSALHESAHWLVAGEERRKLVDFGYWYAPDGRTAEQQKLFEAVEVKPQAIEWILSVAAGHRFRISVDNLNGEATDPTPFKQAVYAQVQHYAQDGLPQRAEKFRSAIRCHYGTLGKIDMACFDLAAL